MGRRPKVGLALGGGGARGLAHIGVLKVLEREGIPIDLIVGTSIGALVGAAYAIKPNARSLEKKVREFFAHQRSGNTGFKRLGKLQLASPDKTDLFHRIVRIAEKHVFLSLAIMKKAFLSENGMEKVLEFFLPDINLEETSIPYYATAVDLISGEAVVLKIGPIIRAVMASSAVPGFMPAVAWNEMMLVDGGVLDSVPASPAKDEGADVVIGVDVGFCIHQPHVIEDGIDTIDRATEIMGFYLNRHRRESADVLIEPAVRDVAWTDFFDYEALIREGEKAAESKIEEIREKLEYSSREKRLKWYGKIFRLIKGSKGKEKFPGLVKELSQSDVIRLGESKEKGIIPEKDLISG